MAEKNKGKDSISDIDQEIPANIRGRVLDLLRPESVTDNIQTKDFTTKNSKQKMNTITFYLELYTIKINQSNYN